MKLTYALIRQVHLFAGLILAVAVLFYTVSGMTLVYARWMPRQGTEETTRSLPIPPAAAANDQALRTFVVQSANAGGRTDGLVTLPTGAMRQRWTWPTGRTEAEVSADRSTVTVTTSRFGIIRTLQNFHVLVGARGGIGYVVWWVLLDVVSLAMLLFAVTGFLLWYRSTKDRRLGWVLFAGSWVYTLGLMAYLMFS